MGVLMFPACAFAQTWSGASLSASGTIADVLARLQQTLADRPIDDHSKLELSAQTKESLEKDIERLHSRLLALRSECARDLRESNRDTKLSTLMHCERSRLSQEMTMLQKLNIRTEQTPGADAGFRTRTLLATSELIDAIRAIVRAIDAGLFQSAAELQMSLARLLERYRIPRLIALERWRADRARAWMSLTVHRIATLYVKETISPEQATTLREGLLCLEKQHALLQSVTTENDYEKIKSIVKQYEPGLKECLLLLRETRKQPKV